MKNKLIDLNNHLFAQLERLSDETLNAGMCLKSLDGNPANTAPENWIAVPRALLPRLGGRYGRGYDAAPAEVKPAIMAIAKIEHSVRTARMNRDTNSP